MGKRGATPVMMDDCWDVQWPVKSTVAKLCEMKKERVRSMTPQISTNRRNPFGFIFSISGFRTYIDAS